MTQSLAGATKWLMIAAAAGLAGAAHAQTARTPGIDRIDTVVVIYAENRSFDNLYGFFPGANGWHNVTPDRARQRDRDGATLKELPPIWMGLTGPGVTPPVTEAETQHLPNRPFAIDDPKGFGRPLSVITRDLWHLFYQNQMQIDGGRNDKFAAFADSGGLVMGYYKDDAAKLPLWGIARRFVLADNYFMGAFGGSFLNHFWLICACTPTYPNARETAAKDKIAAVAPDGVSLVLAADSPASALDGPPKFANNGAISPDLYAVNTMQPPYQPSADAPAQGGDPALADPANPSTLPPQTQQTIGDLLSAKGVSWAWYSGAWQAAMDAQDRAHPPASFQYHHQPFNYFADMAPGMAARAEHVRDGGMDGVLFLKAIDAGTLPQVTFYKPQGTLNEHSGYASVLAGDKHISDVIGHLRRSKQWPHMLILVTYDENGGFWDHVAPPKGDRWGPGSRVPLIIVSPYARRGFVDHTQYDTTSILRFITRRFGLPTLPGISARDAALAASGGTAMGDLTAALDPAR